MQKKECKYIFHNPNQKEEMEKIWTSLLVEIYISKIRDMRGGCKKKEKSERRTLSYADLEVRSDSQDKGKEALLG